VTLVTVKNVSIYIVTTYEDIALSMSYVFSFSVIYLYMLYRLI